MSAECRAPSRVYSIRAAEVIADKMIRIIQILTTAEGNRGIQAQMENENISSKWRIDCFIVVHVLTIIICTESLPARARNIPRSTENCLMGHAYVPG
jgi:hypothetical protein